MNSILRLAIALTLLCIAPWVRAGYLGHSVGLTFEIAQNIPVLIGDPPPPLTTDFGLATVGSGFEFLGAMNWNVDVSDKIIRFAFDSNQWFTQITDGFLGFRLRDADGTLPNIVGVSIGLQSHVTVDPSKISFDADNILVDMGIFVEPGGLQFSSGGGCINAPPGLCQEVPLLIRVFQPEFILNVQFAAVPEPATSALVCGGLLLLAGRRRRS